MASRQLLITPTRSHPFAGHTAPSATANSTCPSATARQYTLTRRICLIDEQFDWTRPPTSCCCRTGRRRSICFLKEALSLGLKARAERRSKKPRIRFVPSKVVMTTNLGRGLASSLKEMGRKVLRSEEHTSDSSH